MVDFAGVSKSLGGRAILRNVSLRVATGEVVCVVGPSGAGKTTLLRCINWLEKPDSGAIYVDGTLMGCRLDPRNRNVLRELPERDVAVQRADIGMVFQRFNLFPHMNVLENLIEAPMRVRKESRAEAAARGRELLKSVGLADREDAYPARLSGGEQQRVAIARALNMRPKLLLFDEPTSALDPQLVGEVLDVIKKLAREGRTMIVVTHHLDFAQEVADRAVFMCDGEIVEVGAARAMLSSPTHPRTREFVAARLSR